MHQLENTRTELIDIKSTPCEKYLESSKLVTSGNVESSLCSFCLERKHEVKDILEAVRAKYAKLKDTIESIPCASCVTYKFEVAFLKEKHARAIKTKTCESCVNFGKQNAYLKGTLEKFSKGKKQLNMILDMSKTPYKKQGLGYNSA